MQIDGSLRSLLQGVSQQHRRDRIDGQCTEQVNMVADVVRNLVRRPASKLIENNLFGSTDDWKIHLHDAGDEQYLVFVRQGEVRVFDLSGIEQTVTLGTTTYLDSVPDPASNLSLTTIGDYTIVANSAVTPALTADVSTSPDDAVLWVRNGGQFGKKYDVHLAGATVTYTCPASGALNLGTNEIAVQLASLINGNGTMSPLYTATAFGSTVKIVRDSGSGVIDVQTTDGGNDEDFIAVSSNVNKLSHLPVYHTADKIIKVTGDDSSDANDFYMRYDIPAGESKGVWVESVATGVNTTIDEETVPHALVRTSAGQFYFGQLDGSTQDSVVIEEWLTRDAGDDDSNSAPPFIGTPINHVTQFQNRLVILAGEYCLLSKTNSFFNFWNTSVLTVLDDDRIELTTPAARYTEFKQAEQHNRHLVVFSDNEQFVIKGNAALTPKNAAMSLATAYTSDIDKSNVLSIGGSIFFPYKNGTFTGVRDFLTGETLEQNVAESLTEHVNRYMTGRCLQVLGSSNTGQVFVRTDDDLSTVFAYQFLWQGGERVQSAWGKWKFDREVVSMHIVDNLVYVVLRNDSNILCLVSIDLADELSFNLDFNLYGDYMELVTPVADVVTYTQSSGKSPADVMCVAAASHPHAGMEIEVLSTNGGTVTLANGEGPVWMGIRYDSEYTPTMPMVKDENNIKISTDRLMLSTFLISVEDSGHFDFEVSSRWKDTTTQHIDVARTGSIVIGEARTDSGTYEVGVLEDADIATAVIKTSSPYPLNVLDIEWRGQYQKRGKRL